MSVRIGFGKTKQDRRQIFVRLPARRTWDAPQMGKAPHMGRTPNGTGTDLPH